jgi:hypothetical protein
MKNITNQFTVLCVRCSSPEVAVYGGRAGRGKKVKKPMEKCKIHRKTKKFETPIKIFQRKVQI